MDDLQERISLAVRHFLVDQRMTQRDLAKSLGMSQSKTSFRLTGRTEWRSSEIEQLAHLGVHLPEISNLKKEQGDE